MRARHLIPVLGEDKQLDATDFLKKRQQGAADLAEKARSKGGPALLTAVHFEAKARPYADSIHALEEGDDLDDAASKADEALARLSGWRELSMDEFQRLTGELEALGECYLKASKS